MRRISSIKKIFLLCAAAFVFLLWADEIFDLPHLLFGTEATPVNYSEALLETVMFLVVCAAGLVALGRVEEKIKYPEGMVKVCRQCGQVEHCGFRIPTAEWIERETEVRVENDTCDSCRKTSPEP